MGRTLKRVPIDFNWPIGQIWKGYVNPYQPVKCRTCDGSGYSAEAKELSDKWYGWGGEEWIDQGNGRRYNNLAWQYHLDEDDVAALLEHDRLWDFTRRPINDEQEEIVRKKMASGENSWLPFNNGYKPTPDEVNEWAKQGMGHDSLNRGYVVEAKCKRLGVPYTCGVCDGDGHIWQTDEIEELANKWEDFEPPKGKGFQLWETTSEGSPTSPVFKTLDDLCEWAEKNATTFGSFKATKDEWRKMLDDDFVVHEEGNHVFM